MASGLELLYMYICMSMSMCCVCVWSGIYQSGKNSYKINKKKTNKPHSQTTKQTRKLKQRQRTGN